MTVSENSRFLIELRDASTASFETRTVSWTAASRWVRRRPRRAGEAVPDNDFVQRLKSYPHACGRRRPNVMRFEVAFLKSDDQGFDIDNIGSIGGSTAKKMPPSRSVQQNSGAKQCPTLREKLML
jgi:hypothetical protein